MLLTVVPTIIGYILLLVPGVMLQVLLYFAFPLFVINNEPIMEAITKSCKWVWGYWWRTFAVLFLATIAAVVLMGLVSVMGSAVGGAGFIVKGVLEIILGIIFIPWFYAVMIILFQDLKLRREPAQT